MKAEVSMHARFSKRASLVAALLAALVAALAAATVATSASKKAAPPAPAALKKDMAAVKGMAADARDAKLYDLAQQEGGGVNFYTSLTSLSAPALVKAFTAQYPN